MTTTAPTRPAPLALWLAASRPRTLPAAIAPVVIGTAIAIGDGRGHALAAIAALLGAVWIQIGTNFANDYYDFKNGTDTEDRVGPTRATAAGWVRPETMRTAFVIAFGIATLFGAYLMNNAKQLVIDFLDGTGVKHEEGMIESMSDLPDEAKVAETVQALDEKYDPQDVTLYLALAAEQWPSVTAVESAWQMR